MRISVRACFVWAVVSLAAAAIESTACAQHSDIFITNLGDAQTGIGGADVDGGHFDIDTRVFEGVMIAGGSADYSRNEPGFFALSDLAPSGLFPAGSGPLAADSLVSFAFRSFSVSGNSGELFYWDGAGPVDFQPAAGVDVSLSDADEQASASGALDFHPDFQIDDPLGTPSGGVYLASLTARSGSLAPSEPIFLVWLVDASITDDAIAEETEEAIEAGLAFQFFEEAAEYVKTHIAVPEPSSAALALLTVCATFLHVRPTQRRNLPLAV